MFDWESWRTWEIWISQTSFLNFALVIGISAVSYVALRVLMSSVLARIVNWLSTGKGRWSDYAAEVFKHTSRLLIAAMALQIGLAVVELGPVWDARVSHLWFLVLALQFGLWVDAAIAYWKEGVIQDKAGQDNQLTVTMVALMFRIVLWAVVLLSVLANLGVDITAFVASLGIGGIAIALAVQTLLGDLFASASIGVDKPFKTGHFIVFNDIAGTIEYIGLKTTRIRSLSGEQILCSNTKLLQQTIHNYSRMSERRVVFSLAISFRTPVEKARELPPLIQQAVEAVENTRFDRAHLLMFDDYALRYEVVYYVLSADYNLYMDIQQAINFSLLEELSKRNIKFAMPVRALEFQEEVPLPKGHGFDQEAVPSTQPTSRSNEGSRKA
ncbi:mechanosensitive ion channel family protein [Vreelandella sulfidaeris]|uniref:Mechanosensitive ion channel family protein n=1 Tax=Vreelandella sulfidaeris TaxID=115553 RepID=A0A365TIC0_9GAMM|nr:mechanosensitive ion channel family protein [Halomonas sulfidaeris]RBI65285.1 mechanosensitive ion channel family protein [Halomonas sulfidaeris]